MAVCEKRTLDETVHIAKNVLLDIEGTTTSISFVKVFAGFYHFRHVFMIIKR